MTDSYAPWVYKELGPLMDAEGRVKPSPLNKSGRKYLLEGKKISIIFPTTDGSKYKSGIPRRMLAAFSGLCAAYIEDDDDCVETTAPLNQSAVNYIINWMFATCIDGAPVDINIPLGLNADLYLYQAAQALQVKEVEDSMWNYLMHGYARYGADYREVEAVDALFNNWDRLKLGLATDMHRRREEGRLSKPVKRYIREHAEFEALLDTVATAEKAESEPQDPWEKDVARAERAVAIECLREEIFQELSTDWPADPTFFALCEAYEDWTTIPLEVWQGLLTSIRLLKDGTVKEASED